MSFVPMSFVPMSFWARHGLIPDCSMPRLLIDEGAHCAQA